MSHQLSIHFHREDLPKLFPNQDEKFTLFFLLTNPVDSKKSKIDRWQNEPIINIEQVKILSESKIDAHLIDKRIINSKNPNCKEVQAFYKEDLMQGSLF